MRLNNVVIATREYSAMVDFYQSVTGWPILFQNRFCTFIGRGMPHIVLHPVVEEPEVSPAEGSICLDFEVADLDEEAARLESAGHKLDRRSNMLVLHDPVGNLIEITQGTPR